MKKLAIVTILILGLATGLLADNRSYDASGNNVANPGWGAAGAQFDRLGPARYGDNVSTPSGATMPNARDVSNMVGAQSSAMPDPHGRSDYVWQWGQFLDHDITLTPGGSEFFPIDVTNPADPLFPMVPMMRSAFDPATGTGVDNPRQQINDNTSFVDASMVYGSDIGRANALRTMSGGRLQTSEGGLMLPRNTGLLPNANDGTEPDATLFLAGDVRANEQPGLVSMHTLFVREHNRLADQLAAANPNWSDEEIFQRARKYVGGIVQNITYGEYLPALLGNAAPVMQTASYDNSVDPSISNEFATSAFRLGHSQVSPAIMRMEADGTPAPGGSVDIKDAFFAPSFFTSPDEIDYLLYGLATQVQQSTDAHIIDDLRNTLFGAPGSGGMDLLALNIQRSRDHGLGTYVELQADMGMPMATSFADISSDPAVQSLLAFAYGDIENVDQWIGLLAEDDLPDAAVGSSMAIIVADQFERLMVGDRFFYLWDDDLSADEIEMISSMTLADVIQNNTDISGLQSNVFFVPEPAAGMLMAFAAALGWLAHRRRRNG